MGAATARVGHLPISPLSPYLGVSMQKRILFTTLAGCLSASACLGSGDSFTTSSSGNAVVQFVNASNSSVQFIDEFDASINQAGITWGNNSHCFSVNAASSGLIVVPSDIGGYNPVPLLGLVPNDTFMVTVMPILAGGVQFNTFYQAFTPAAGQAGLRVINASPQLEFGPNVDAYATPLGGSLGTTPNAANIIFPHGSGYFNLPPGSYDVKITNAGTQTVIADAGEADLTAGSLRTVVVTDPAPDALTQFRAFVVSPGC